MHAITTADVERMKAILRQRIADAEATRATAMLSEVWRVQLAELEAADDGSANGSPGGQERLLDAAEMAYRLGMTRKQLYNRSSALPFTRRVGKHTLRFSERGFQKWLEKGGKP